MFIRDQMPELIVHYQTAWLQCCYKFDAGSDILLFMQGA